MPTSSRSGFGPFRPAGPFWLLLMLAPSPILAANITLLGTTVDADGVSPSVGVRVTLWPQGISALSDRDGDFLIEWDGSRGWLTLVPPDSMVSGALWCKRLALQPSKENAPERTRDLGLIRVTGRARLTYQTLLALPRGVARPDSLDLPGPPSGGRDTCHVRLRYDADIWGRITKVEQVDGDRQPAALVDSILDWIRHVAWVVPSETRCDGNPPFSSLDEVTYTWSGRSWMRLDAVQARIDQNRRKREAKAPPPGSAPK